MRKALATLAVTAAAFTAPMLASGTAYAEANIYPPVALPSIGSSIQVDTSAAQELIYNAIGGGCTTTFAGKVIGTGIGGIVTVSGLIVTINGYAAEAYAFAQEGNTVGYVFCMA